jgi:hypothetical protein
MQATAARIVRAKQSENSKITSWSRILLEKLTVPQLVKKFPTLYGTARFIAVCTRAHHLAQ